MCISTGGEPLKHDDYLQYLPSALIRGSFRRGLPDPGSRTFLA